MPWQNEMVRIVRYLIDDIVEPYTYSNERLEETILVAAQLGKYDASYAQNYTIDVDSLALSPDPTTAGSKDDGFINLTSIKTAMIVLNAEVKLAASQAVQVTDGPSSINMASAYKAIKERADELAKRYQEAIVRYQLGGAGLGEFVTGPITNESLSPHRLHL